MTLVVNSKTTAVKEHAQLHYIYIFWYLQGDLAKKIINYYVLVIVLVYYPVHKIQSSQSSKKPCPEMSQIFNNYNNNNNTSLI